MTIEMSKFESLSFRTLPVKISIMQQRLPMYLKRFFWDCDFDQLHSTQHAAYIIGRLLDIGDERAIRWMRKRYPKKHIADILSTHRCVSPKSANFWALLLDLPREGILCLQKHYQERQRKHWPY